MHRAHATERSCSDGAAVIRIFTADNEPLLRLTQQLIVAVNELNLSVICLGTRIRKKHFIEVRGRHGAQSGCQFNSGLIRAPKKIVISGTAPRCFATTAIQS